MPTLAVDTTVESVKLGNAGLTTIVLAISVDPSAEPFALIVKLNVPTTVGVPETAPVEVFRLIPLGNAPETIL